MIIKFNDQNDCSEANIEEFISLPFKNKIFFTCKDWIRADQYKKSIGKGSCAIKQFPKSESIKASYEPFGKNKYLDISGMINSL